MKEIITYVSYLIFIGFLCWHFNAWGFVFLPLLWSPSFTTTIKLPEVKEPERKRTRDLGDNL